MILHGMPSIIQQFFPKRTWKRNAEGKKIYLTFDDGPVVGVTDFVLEQLDRFGMKATFFMVGENVRKNPKLAMEVQAGGHGIGNHTMHHLNGWHSSSSTYFEDFLECEEVFKSVFGRSSVLFRPPYGMIKGGQVDEIRRSHEIIMWNVLSGDYNPKLMPKQVFDNTAKRSKTGSIVVFHDQEKTASILPKILPDYLNYIRDQGYEAAVL